ncbi:MAG TPA: hypothetical protein ENL37_03820 [Desulfobacteraceae bacterium]|nr:hypothetical protein [Desulfobacteraceae bacterium]
MNEDMFQENLQCKNTAGSRTGVLIAALGVLACMSLLLVASLAAEPSPAVEYLMREPVSMLDWGLAQIEEDLFRNRGVLTRHAEDLFEPEPSIRVAYTWEENRIQIFLKLTMQAMVKKSPQRMAAVRKHVEFVIAYLRGGLTMYPYDAFLRHKGFRSKESPQNLDEDLVDITDIHITVCDHQQNILSRCRAPLSGKEIVWSNMGGS